MNALPKLLLLAPIATLLAPAPSASADVPRDAFSRTETREPCERHLPERTPHFGDLHVHTRLSLDAAAFGTRAGPREAYRFARGEAIDLPPYDRDGRSLQRARIDRPLDFAAVTDHAEFFGEIHICETEGLAGYRSPACIIYRRWPLLAHFLGGQRGPYGNPPRRYRFCGEQGRHCIEASRAPWRAIAEAAEEAYDRSSACSFTSFVAYEWTGTPGGNNLHRNVVFRNEVAPEFPISYADAPLPSELWERLTAACIEGLDRCDVLAIPHNSNLSGGLMFNPVGPGGAPLSPKVARSRAILEPLVEMMQHKGESECRNGVGSRDELCNFEQLPSINFQGLTLGREEEPPPLSLVRNALKEGLAQEARMGVNPFRFGVIGSTDTHFAAPGAVSESSFAGHMYPGGSGPSLPEKADFNPGGIAVLWAEENSRDALFAAMRRREAYGTSGPRMKVRFFGGWELPPDLCERSDLPQRGYATGVAMGGVLGLAPERLSSRAPRFAVRALKDAGVTGSPGTDLQRIQIIKGSLTRDGLHETVFEVAGNPANGASVDEATCAPAGAGSDELCAVWTDPDFDASEPAFYYARVLENPSCRWSTYACNAHRVDCSKPDPIPAGLASCCDPRIPRTIQERAWTSPIWYSPH